MKKSILTKLFLEKKESNEESRELQLKYHTLVIKLVKDEDGPYIKIYSKLDPTLSGTISYESIDDATEAYNNSLSDIGYAVDFMWRHANSTAECLDFHQIIADELKAKIVESDKNIKNLKNEITVKYPEDG